MRGLFCWRVRRQTAENAGSESFAVMAACWVCSRSRPCGVGIGVASVPMAGCIACPSPGLCITLPLLHPSDTDAPHTPVVWLQSGAPAKPPEGAPCNGCGLCCLAEPCPLGVVVSLRRKGPCKALRWSDDDQRYWCGMVSDPGGVTGLTRPWAVRAVATLARRWIASGAGCDAQLISQVASHPSAPQPPST